MNKEVFTLYLRLDSSAKSLYKRALSQLIFKIIYSLETNATKEKIISDLNEVINSQISIDKIEEALNVLDSEGKIEIVGTSVKIKPHILKEVEIIHNEFLSRQSRIIKKYFDSSTLTQPLVKNWFENVTMSLFKVYSQEWISDLSKLTNGSFRGKKDGMIEIINKETFGFKEIQEEDRKWLIAKYIKFIESDNDLDVSLTLWNYGTSCFSSTLLTANNSADPITIDKFLNSYCILDTNILMYLELEGGELKKYFEILENYFQKLNIKIGYFSTTRDEFTRSMEFKKKNVLKVVQNFSKEVIDELNDPFIFTGYKRGCVTLDDFSVFFDEIIDISKYFSSTLEIKNFATIEIEDAIEKGMNDEVLKDKINKAYFDKTRKDKRKNAVNHDAGLLSGAFSIRSSGEKCFILSRDNILNEVALGMPIRDESPIAISLDSLLNLLAMDNGGVSIDPMNYAPLFANIIKFELFPENQTFQVEDLSLMLDVQSQIADLSKDDILQLANKIHNSQREGVKEEDIALEINRIFQRGKLTLVTDLDKANKESSFERHEKEKFIKKSNKSREALGDIYRQELVKKYRKELLQSRIIYFAFLPLFSVLIVALIVHEFNQTSQNYIYTQIISMGINILCWFLCDIFFVNKKINSKTEKKLKTIDHEVEERLIRELDS